MLINDDRKHLETEFSIPLLQTGPRHTKDCMTNTKNPQKDYQKKISVVFNDTSKQ